ncbi:hypothetical protein J2732_005440 [Achromobacter deleyi]|uniref:hypothetical protein n=1 Tax=Achromobacter TaxID=222 RepID=UPI001E454234|nr:MULTISPECIES: hypothetical protein [Achromobacter]MDR6604405.1 hypothetical protein [Achromobacter deleyi]
MTAWPDWAKWVGLGLLLSAVQAGVMLWRGHRRRVAARKDTQRLQAVRIGGVASTARVTAARDTRSRIGDTLYFVIELDLDVAATAATPALTRTLAVPLSPLHLADFGVGKTVRVRVDAITHEIALDQPTG